MTRSHTDLELLVSYWSVEMHTFFTSWKEFIPILKDVLVMFCLSLIADEGAMGLVLSKEEAERLQLLKAALKVSNKSK